MALIRKDNHVLYAGWDVDVISSDGTVEVHEYEPNKFDLSVGDELESRLIQTAISMLTQK